jgi:membrane protein
MKKRSTSKSGLYLFAASLLPSLALLRKNDPLRMAGATAFFTTFALPPIIFLLAQLFGLFISPKTVGRGLIENLSHNLGADGAEQVRQVIRSIRGFNDHWYVILLGFCFLFFVATTLFIVIRNSFNEIWQVNVKEKPGFLFKIGTRLRSAAVILLVGLLFFANIFFNSIETIGGDYLEGFFQGSRIYFKLIFSEISSIVIVAAWFIILFRFLADARPRWKAALAGGLLTGILFTVGRFILRILLIDGNIGQLYGASGSFVLVLLFVFYTSFIMYYGACFVAVFSEKKKWSLQPDGQSYGIKTVAG